MSDRKIISLRGDLPRGEVNDKLVTMLEDCLAMAQRGELVSAAVAGVFANGQTSAEWHHGTGWQALSAAITYTQHRLMRAVEDEA